MAKIYEFDEATNRSPLHMAVEAGDFDAVKQLVTGDNIEAMDKEGRTPFYVACNRSLDIVKFLASIGADLEKPEKNGLSPLHRAVINNKLKTVQFLLSKQVNIESVDKNAITPLHCAAINGYPEIAQCLLSAGANTEAVNKCRNTPLHFAAASGHLKIAEGLLSAGANIESVNGDGNTPLHCAAIKGHPEVAQCLLSAGANIESVNHDLITPFFSAVQNNRLEVVEFLINKKANIEATNNKGKTALEITLNPSLVKILTYEGARDFEFKLLKDYGYPDLRDASTEAKLLRDIAQQWSQGAVAVIDEVSKIPETGLCRLIADYAYPLLGDATAISKSGEQTLHHLD